MVHPFAVLMAYFRNLFGGQNDDGKESDNAAEVVEKLVERVETSTAYEDRRDALKALRSLAKKTRLPVATIGMAAYMEVLEKERSNPEIIAITLEILVAVVCDDEETAGGTDELGERLSEIIVRRKGFISSIMSLVECYEFNVRRALVQLLTALLRHRASEVQNAIMSEPMGVSRLVDILHETREAVRNSAVLMLSELSRANSQIQQLLAYENAFQLLFDIIDVEPVDSIVIEDCLFVILNLLRKNSSNQQLFREASLIQRLATVLHSFLFGREGDEETESESEWPRQKIANVIFLLQVLRSLVSPRENVITNTHAAQKSISQSGMLGELCSVLLTELGVPVEVLTETIIAVAEVIRGNYTNQEYFAARHLLTNVGNRPSLLVLLMSMTTEKQPFKLRCAVFYCFLSYLYDNEFGKTKVVDTLLPSSTTNDSQITTGQCICSAIMSSESVQVWMGCVCLMHCLFDADHLKEQLLRVQLTIDSAQAPSSLLRHIATLLV
uniref:Vesicle tethering protein Uso1/P115-like head domain-containing protein n=1 Tax=Parascaris univalens TaxID=6257 RepID=A0A915C6F5_PARUN